MTGVTNPMGEAIQYAYTYNATGLLTEIIDANNHITAMQNNTLGQMIQKTWADNSYETYVYDPVGNMTDMMVYEDTATLVLHNSMTYDVLNRMDIASYGLEDGVADYIYDYNYTSTNRLDSVNDSSRGVTDYTYDDLDRPTNVEQPDGNSISYAYDPNGNRTGITTPAGTVNYTYDALNRIDSVTDFIADPAGATTSLTYTPLGLMDTITRPNGVTTDYTYDARHRLTNIIHGSFATGDPHTFSYSYDLANNATQLVETRNGTTTTTDWQYDDAYRLLTETTDRSGAAMTTAFAYDAMGNRLSQTTGGVTTNYTYNELDQLIFDGYATYEYDAQGNLVELTAEGLTTTYTYDAQNRLTGMEIPVIGSLNYTYDHRGQRVQENTPDGIVNYLWDDFSTYGNIVYEFDNADQVLASYTYAGNTLLAQTRGGFTSYYLQDAIGSTHALTDESGNVIATYDYDAFGELVEDTGTVENDFLFTGQQFDELSGLYNLRARFYNPSLGRFNGRDTFLYNFQNPFELNRYAYATNNPINLTDLTGQSVIFEYTGINATAMRNGAIAGAAGGFVSSSIYVVLTQFGACGDAQRRHFSNEFNRLSFIAGSTIAGAASGAAIGAIFGSPLSITHNGVTLETTLGTLLKYFKYSRQIRAGGLAYTIAQAFSRGVCEGIAAIFGIAAATGIANNLPAGSPIGGTGTGTDIVPAGGGSSIVPVGGGGGAIIPSTGGSGGGTTGGSGGGGSNELGFCNSFSADTIVSTTEGDIPIAQVEIGNKVYAFDPETNEVGEYAVTDTISHEDDVIAYLTIDGEEIETTPWHLFFTDEAWVEVEDLEIGDQVLSLDGDYGKVDELIIVDETQVMYDLTVDVVHTFAIGDGKWVVHNEDEECDVPDYALGNLGDSEPVNEHNRATLALYNPGTTTVFSGVYDIDTGRWIAYPSEGTVLKTGGAPPIGFHVGREGGHRRVLLQWRTFDSTVFNGGGTGYNRNIGFTLFYYGEGKLGIRWTSRSINESNWGMDSVLPVYVPQQLSKPVIPLWDPVLNGVRDSVGIEPIYLPDTMMPEKPGRT